VIIPPGSEPASASESAKAGDHAHSADVLAADQLGEVFALLFGAAVFSNLVYAKNRVREVRKASRGIDRAHLLHRDCGRHSVKTGATVFFRNQNSEQSQGSHLRESFPVKALFMV
jgi:hypothetical protein